LSHYPRVRREDPLGRYLRFAASAPALPAGAGRATAVTLLANVSDLAAIPASTAIGVFLLGRVWPARGSALSILDGRSRRLVHRRDRPLLRGRSAVGLAAGTVGTETLRARGAFIADSGIAGGRSSSRVLARWKLRKRAERDAVYPPLASAVAAASRTTRRNNKVVSDLPHMWPTAVVCARVCLWKFLFARSRFQT